MKLKNKNLMVPMKLLSRGIQKSSADFRKSKLVGDQYAFVSPMK